MYRSIMMDTVILLMLIDHRNQHNWFYYSKCIIYMPTYITFHLRAKPKISLNFNLLMSILWCMASGYYERLNALWGNSFCLFVFYYYLYLMEIIKRTIILIKHYLYFVDLRLHLSIEWLPNLLLFGISFSNNQ